MPDLRAVLLDAGGTLIHPDRDFILARLAEEGITATLEAYHDARRLARDAVGDILRSTDPGTDATRARTYFAALLTALGLPPHRLAAFGGRIRQRHEEGRLWVHMEPDTLEALDALKRAGLRLAVISNADGRVAEYLENAGLDGRFEFVLDSTVVGIEKPDPRIFTMACERLGVAPGETVYVGDTYEVDVLGARAAGIRAVLLVDQPRDDVACIGSIAELPAALGLARAAPGAVP
ncbi:MAG TPA: HAD-IA family hydrolase [Longimicrobiales bacterium]|nr:HAD-IA family hydrolase [Longimicrobiales bacterium]